MTHRPIRRLLSAALWALLLAYAIGVAHDFYAHVDRAISVTIDDGEAAITYALAMTGRYAFFPSPVLFDMSRLHGQFNYGPWYFYVAAAAIHVFGYSLTLVRSIHLWVVLGCIAAAGVWFRGRDRAAVPVLFGLGLLYFFDTVEWPMVRPDSFVSAFAVLLVISVGLAWQRGQARYWFLAGLTAACGALTHLIAVSLLGSVFVLFGVAVASRRTEIYRSGAALAAGVLVAATMFYASFHFDFAGQWYFLRGYRELTATSDSYVGAVQRHFQMTFAGTPRWLQASVWLSLVAAWVMVAAAVVRAGRYRDLVMAYILPPAIVWTLYLVSIGKYTNYHTGYGILHHVMFLWTVSAMAWTLWDRLDHARPFAGMVVGSLAMVLVIGQGARQITWLSAGAGFAARAEHRVSFDDYVDRVIGGLPSRALAWGTVFFGIESPDRIQLVQHDDALAMFQRLKPAERPALAPDFLVWGYPEVRDETLAVLKGGDTRLTGVRRLLPDARFRLAALVDGAPYGVTRVYSRIADGEPADIVPSVAMYDEVHHQWLDRIGAPLASAFDHVAPVSLRIGYEAAPAPRAATSTMAADLPPGRYLLKIAIKSGAGPAQRLIAVTPWTVTKQTVQDLGLRPRGDFADYLSKDHEVYAVSVHPGGLLYVSQFDDSDGAAIDSVTASPVLGPAGLGTPVHDLRQLPDFTQWIPMPGVRMLLTSGRLRVEGDASVGGYQLFSPVIRSAPGEMVEIDAPSRIVGGEVCAGILNAKGQWLLSASEWRRQLDFYADASDGFRVAFANCQTQPQQTQSRFEASAGSYVRSRPTPYADRLFGLSFEGLPRSRFDQVEAPVVKFPAQPRVQLEPAGVEYQADVVRGAVDAWSIEGRVSTPSALLLRSRPRYVDSETRLLVSGHLSRGGVIVGLAAEGQPPIQVRVAEPGAFTAIMAPPSSGRYSVIISNDSASGPDVSAVLDRIDWVPPMRPSK